MTNQVEAERRAVHRVGVALDVDCRCGDHFLYAKATDLSELGIFVVTPTPRPVGESVALYLRQASQDDPFFESSESTSSLEIRGVVRWSTLGEEGGRSGMGIALEIDDLITRSHLLELIARLALVDTQEAA